MSPVALAMGAFRRVYPTNAYSEFLQSEIEQSIAARFEKQVVQHGQRLAIRTRQYELTYDGLNRLANRLARSLNERTSPKPAAVAILLDHDAPLIATILAVLKSGRFYVALEPAHPSERLRYLLEDSEADLLITDTKHLGRAEDVAPQRCALFNLDELNPEVSDKNLNRETSPPALAYLIYTSGSTGKPKGVCQTQRNVLHHTRKYTNSCHLSADDRFSLLALCSFSASVSNLFGALLNGGALLPFNVKEEGVASLSTWLYEEKISIYHSVPLLFRNLAKAVGDSADFPSLRLIKLGGEPITRSDFDLFQHFAPHALLYVGLGASEMNCIRYLLLDRHSDFSGPVAPVGFAVEDTDVLLLDESLQELPAGEIGEIAVRSPYLFPGYWRRPELTESVFVSDPGGSTVPVFRTGDLGRMLPGGLLQHLGRNEFQIKIRGARVEVAEVEFALRNNPHVDECVVIAVGGNEDRQLIAYLTNKTGHRPEPGALRDRLAGKLPEYMLPARFVWLDTMPLTNGKINRKALAELGSQPSSPADNYVAPRSDLERQLVEIWQKVLQRDRVGIRDKFLDLGGHSLSAARVAVEIAKVIPCNLPISSLLRLPTIESLANYLAQGDAALPFSSLVPLQPAGRTPPLFIVHGWGGDVHFFHPLAKLLPNQPTYGLQAVGLDGKAPRHTSVEQMARHYVREIRAFQLEGPYYLAGFSLGGLIAFEVGQQLYQEGQTVALLGLVDPPTRPAPWIAYLRALTPFLWRRAHFHFRECLRTFGREDMHLRHRWKALRNWITSNRRRPSVVITPPKCTITPPEIPGFGDYYSAVAKAYRLRHYPGSIDVIIGDSLREGLLPLWGHLAKGGVVLHQISGTHREMIQGEHLPALASALAVALNRAHKQFSVPASDEIFAEQCPTAPSDSAP